MPAARVLSPRPTVAKQVAAKQVPADDDLIDIAARSPYTDEEAVVKLAAYIADKKILPSGFCSSLLAQHKNKGALSEKQQAWVHKLVVEADAVCFCKPIVDFFDSVNEKVKNPRMIFDLSAMYDDDAQGTVSIARASVARNRVTTHGESKCLWVTTSLAPSCKWVIDHDTGKIHAHFHREPLPASVRALLEQLAASPQTFAAEYGKTTSRCCFCHLPLSVGKSLAVGYGRTCAFNYGLPWGGVPPPRDG